MRSNNLNFKLTLESETCIDVQIKSESIAESKLKKLTVKGYSTSGTYKFEDTKPFTTKKINSFTLIETDKPAYKPKDKGYRFRHVK